MPVPAVIFPAANRTVYYGKEATSGTPATAFVAVPVNDFQPKDHQDPLVEESLHGDPSELYGHQFGPRWTEHTIPESPVYLDVIGHFLLNIAGDYYATGTAASPNSTLNGGVAAGVTSITVASGTGFAANQWIQIDTGVNAEIVQILSVATNVLTLTTATPTRFSHLTGVAVTNTTAPYTHTFSQLNPGSTTGVTDCQTPSGTMVDKTYIPGSGNNNGRLYAFSRLSSLKFTAKNSGWFSWDAKALSYFTVYPSAPVTASFSSAKPQPSWRSTVTVGGTARSEIAEWSLDLKRAVTPEPTADGTQDPYTFAQGKFGCDWTLDYNPVIDESSLLNYVNNTQPTLVWAVTNSLSGANLLAMTISAQLGAYTAADIAVEKTTFGYKASGRCISNVTNAGNSGGHSPVSIQLQNAVQTY